MKAQNPLLVTLAYITMCLIWGSTWMVIKIGLRGAPPLTSVAVRFAIAGAIVAIIIVAARWAIPRERRFVYLGVFLGITHMATPYMLVYWGETQISSSLAALLYSTMPIMVMILARVFLGDPISRHKVVGIVIGIAGVWLIFSNEIRESGTGAGLGVLALLVSVFFASVASVTVKKFGDKYNPVTALLIPFVVGTIATAAIAIPVEQSDPRVFSSTTWLTILYLAMFGSVAAFTLFFWVVKRVDVTVVSYQTFIIPLIAVVLGWIFLDETIGLRVAGGAALIMAAIIFATRGGKRGGKPNDGRQHTG